MASEAGALILLALRPSSSAPEALYLLFEVEAVESLPKSSLIQKEDYSVLVLRAEERA